MVSDDIRLREVALESDPVAQMVIDGAGVVTLINERARALFGLTADDVGRPLQRPRRSRTGRSSCGRRSRRSRPGGGRWSGRTWPGAARRASPGSSTSPCSRCWSWTAASSASRSPSATSPVKALQEELQQSKQALETAYEELQSSNEELETTNEELQSTNEELETTNEELQSTNEELETMNEELQSTNEELQTINDELRQRTDELNDSNAFLGSILSSLRGGVVVIDRDLKVLVWNDRAADLWGLRADEVQGRHLLNLDIGLPLSELRQPIRACLAKESRLQHVELSATNRRGRPIRCTVTCTPLDGGPDGGVRGVILLMETQDDAAPA